MKLKINIWAAILDIINAVLFFLALFAIVFSSFSDAFGGTQGALPVLAVFFNIMALAGLVLSLVQLQQDRRWGVSIVSPILGIIGNLIYPIEPAIGIVSMAILIIASVFWVYQ